MILRLSRKLNAKIMVGTLAMLPLDDNPFADWSAHLFFVDRTQYILVSNTRSLYSTVMYGKGIAEDRRFIERALSSLRESLEQDGLESAYRRFIAPASAAVRFAKALDRRVTGSMNDLIQEAKFLLLERELSPHDVGTELNETPMTAIATSRSPTYGRPREAFLWLAEQDHPAPGR